MREADPVAVDLDDAGSYRGVQVVLRPNGGHRRRRERRRRRARRADIGCEARDAIADDIGQRGRNGKRYSRPGLDLALLQHAPELERVERISSYGLVDAAQQRARERDADPRAQETVEGPDRERANRETADALRRYAIETEWSARLSGHALGKQERDRLHVNAPERELEQQRRRRVEPLDVIDRDEHRSRARQLAECAEESNSHRPRLGRCAPNLVEKKRSGERPPLRRREGTDDLGGIALEQIARRRKGERGLGLRRAARERQPFALRQLDPASPQRRLPDPRLPFEDKNPRCAFAEEPVDDAHLLLTADDLKRRPHLAVIVRTEHPEVKAGAYCAKGLLIRQSTCAEGGRASHLHL